ncbi:MAG: hypothetical protein HKO85_08345 [Xanthomonadales bacterium]|nr:hypothetical protein [Gammaproteobacteria bacterium]MBT8050884.1 hypothetical protein [Gammaproteobacteria bacterium]NNL05288.1 hypothetical protein [Xanthomonadales bacterium]
MLDSARIPARFNGPPDSGNGGYSCGVLASAIEGPARVRLHRPPPLDRDLDLRASDDGVALFDGETRIASGAAAPLELDIPCAPSLDQARQATRRYPCYQGHVFPTCFVCGPGRPDDDGLNLFPGPVDDWSLLACPWQPARDLLAADGTVLPEIVWAALDCPGYFACLGEHPRPAVLGELQVQRFAPVPGAEELVVYAWPLGREGRKCFAGSAVARPDDEVLAAGRATWILLRQESTGV